MVPPNKISAVFFFNVFSDCFSHPKICEVRVSTGAIIFQDLCEMPCFNGPIPQELPQEEDHLGDTGQDLEQL